MPVVLTPSADTAELLEIDPVSEDAANVNLLLQDPGNGYQIDLKGVDYPPPERKPQFAASADTVGDDLISSGYGNRIITAPIRCTSSTAAGLDALVAAIQEKVGKLQRWKGTLKRTTVGGTVRVYDVLDADVDVPDDWYAAHRFTVIVTIKFTCLPLARGDEVQLATFSETSLPVAVVTFAGPEGDAPALGRAAVREASGQDQWHYHRGVQAHYYDGGTTAALHYEAESCLPQGGAVATSLSGASGGSAVYQGTLTTSYQSMLSLASSGTVYKQHVGDFNLWARLYRPTSNAGTVSVALEWAEGDFTRFTRNAEITYDADEREGDFTLAKLGQVHLSEARKGAQRWDGRIIAKSTTVGDDLYVDDWWLQPVTEGGGEVTITPQIQTPTSFTIRDEFDQSAGTLNAKTLPIGGAWTTSGASANDFSVEASGHTVQRTATDTDGRFAIAGTTTFSDVLVGYDFKNTAGASGMMFGLRARWVDSNNSASLTFFLRSDGQPDPVVSKSVAGVDTNLLALSAPILAVNTWFSVRFLVTAGGAFAVWLGRQGGPVELLGAGSDAAFATGGALASGKVGFYDQDFAALASTRSVDNFWAAVPSPDAAIFASKLAEDRYDSFIRQDSAGTVWAGKTNQGDYFTIPVESTVRALFKASRGDPDMMFDSGIDDLAGTIYGTPRYL